MRGWGQGSKWKNMRSKQFNPEDQICCYVECHHFRVKKDQYRPFFHRTAGGMSVVAASSMHIYATVITVQSSLIG